MHKPTNKGQKGSTTAGVAGETTLTGEKPARKRKRDTNMEHSTRKYWAGVKRDMNDG